MIRNFFLERFLKSAAAIGLVLLFVVPARASSSTATNPLKLFKRYFGYNLYIASFGKGARSQGKPDTDISGSPSLAKVPLQVTIPPNAKVRAAFVYWET